MALLGMMASAMQNLGSCFKGGCRREQTDDDVDGGTKVNVTTTNVSNVTCCASKAANRNDDDVYVKTESSEPAVTSLFTSGTRVRYREN